MHKKGVLKLIKSFLQKVINVSIDYLTSYLIVELLLQ